MRFNQDIARFSRCLTSRALLTALLVLGCSHETRDRLNRFFFEVPDQTSQATTDAPTQAATPLPDPPAAPGVRFASLHQPFMERKCGECHDAAARMSPRKDLLDSCKTCHPRYFTPEAGHSPVTQRQCSQCHDAHRSVQNALLKKPTYTLCLQCHDEPALLSPESHSGSDVDRCTACHDPHFGTGKFLKKQAESPRQ